MATSPTVASQKPLEDPLAHLPCSSIVEYKKGQMIYNQDQPSTSIYLVIEGKVQTTLGGVYRYEQAGEVHQLMGDGKLPEGNVAVLVNAPTTGLTDLP